MTLFPMYGFFYSATLLDFNRVKKISDRGDLSFLFSRFIFLSLDIISDNL